MVVQVCVEKSQYCANEWMFYLPILSTCNSGTKGSAPFKDTLKCMEKKEITGFIKDYYLLN